jgi:2-(1,2-epoxy-1,2-dihydrophenyl)acetyl-CoA isomerase
MDSHCIFSLDGNVGILSFNRPDAGNAISPQVVDDFVTAVDAAASSRARAILIRAEGANFSVGADLRHLSKVGDDLPAVLAGMADRTHSAQARLYDFGPPIVAAVKGATVGGGFGIALTADFLIAAASTKFATGYTRLGLTADAGVSYFLTRALGVRRARALLIRSPFLGALEALELGLVERVVPDDELEATSLSLARELADGPTSAYTAIRRQTEAALGNDFATHLDLEARTIVDMAGNAEVAANLTAVLNKQKPSFTG